MTYKQLFNEKKELARNLNKEETAIKILIQEIATLTSSEFYLNLDSEVPNILLTKINNAVDKYLIDNIPIQYILGYTYFYGLKFYVDRNVLIPRRETEELVDWVVKNNPFTNPYILDLATGSGAIAVAIKKHLVNANVYASDISVDSLNVAQKNANLNNVNINFIESNIFNNIEGRFDIIVSNPPYIPHDEILPNLVYNNEPHLALFADDEGLYFYNKILENARNYIKPNSILVFEIPENKDETLLGMCNKYFCNSESFILKDMQNKSRILIVKSNWR